MKKDGKRRLRRVLAIFVFVTICGLAVFVISRAEIRFHIKTVWAQLTTQVALEQIEYSNSQTHVYNIEDITNSNRFIFNQSLVLVNANHTVDEGFPLDLIDYKGTGVLMDSSMIGSYARLSKAVTEAVNDKLYVRSSYRDMAKQEKLYKDSDKATKPGSSEH